ncbi:FAD:protein FMN transferase [Bacillus sp. PS06]|uniref:FAD:protein FMN transferase n=1 Tax=Bacillus sp. PS06 TaxID=2764176 RepID=UPI001786497F|nr:FAD:protein FMN transferase [Bacillus sp. PS06]MBD8071437.1 FAD:protein FMN transferase [Bacillus sp. PS06]
MKIKSLVVIVIVTFFIIAGCSQSKGSKTISTPYKQTAFLMGTVVTVKIYDEGKEAVLEPVFHRIEELARQITMNEENEDESEVTRINKMAGIEPVKVSEDLYKLIESGKQYSQIADGTFDISVGPLTSLWHIGYSDAKKPDESEIQEVLSLIQYEDIELNEDNQTVFLKQSGMKLDLGAIAKGYITDEVLAVLKENQVETAIIDLGGNVYVMGKNTSGKDWTIGIQDPFSPRGEIVGRIAESNISVVTSGVYERYLEVDGVKYHHILNPKDGYPYSNDIAGVTIISDKSMDGDALSTSVFSKGIEDGMAFIEEIEDAEAIFISHDKKISMTSGIKKQFELVNEQFEIVE